MRPIPLHRRRRPEPSATESQQWYAPAVDPALLKLQERLEAIEATRARAAQQAPAAPPYPADHADAQDPDVVIDLDEVGEVSDEPTHVATGEETGTLEERVVALERRVVTAEARARSAEARARAAAARAEDILFALPDLAHELRVLVDSEHPTVDQVEAAIRRMRARVAPQVRDDPASDDPAFEASATPNTGY